jgi:hypothetical protein
MAVQTCKLRIHPKQQRATTYIYFREGMYFVNTCMIYVIKLRILLCSPRLVFTTLSKDFKHYYIMLNGGGRRN